MTADLIYIIIALVFGFYAAWNIGANDVANAMGTSVGSKALSLREAVILAAIFEFLGAVFFGSNVSETLEKNIVNPDVFVYHPFIFINGMLASLLATGLWLQFASYCGLPVSTTHTIVGAIVGFGAVVGGIDAVQWENVFQIAVSWVASPILGAFTSYIVFTMLRQYIFYDPHPLEASKKFFPYIAAVVVLVLSLTMMYRVILPDTAFIIKCCIAITIAVITGICAHYAVHYKTFSSAKAVANALPMAHTHDTHLLTEVDKAKKHLLRVQNSLEGELKFQLSDIVQDMDTLSYSLKKHTDTEEKHTEFFWVEKMFGLLQISSACLMAFAHGSNDVSNAIGPMAAIVSTIQRHFGHESIFPSWALVLGGVGIVIGLATWGWRVIETIGKRITELTPSRGFAAEFGAALIILLASRFGFPISTTHTIVGSVIGVGLAGGIASLNLRTLRDIVLSWFITIPAGAILSIFCFYVLEALI